MGSALGRRKALRFGWMREYSPDWGPEIVTLGR